MDRIEQFTTIPLIGESGVVACVDYQVCDYCGFRLVRVETTMINDQHIVTKHCPICHQSRGISPDGLREVLSDKDILLNFNAWLATHGLDQETLENHYHLKMENFFNLV